MIKVALLKVEDYRENEVNEALAKGLSLLGIEEDFFRGKKVLLKPNFLAPSAVDKAVCTHPVVFKGIASLAGEMGAQLTAGDSPGFGSASMVASACGINGPLQELGIPLVPFNEKVKTSFPEGRVCKSFLLAPPVVEADVVVSLARLKTHNLTYYTGAVKNLYGCIPGREKAALHLRYHDIENFSSMLADLYGLVKPELAVVDGIVSMEGPGPRGGSPRKTGFIVLSKDAVAADTVACKLVGIEPEEVLHLKYAGEMGFGVADFKDIEIVGDSFTELKVKGFKKADGAPLSTGFIPTRLSKFLRNCFIPLPFVQEDSCRGCSICAESCPPKTIAMEDKAVIDHSKCIRCYCCQELCPHKAIKLKKRFRFPCRLVKNTYKR